MKTVADYAGRRPPDPTRLLSSTARSRLPELQASGELNDFIQPRLFLVPMPLW